MRTDPRYTRVRDMLTDEAVPRLRGGGIALCHHCQRAVYFAGGFLTLVFRQLEWTAHRVACGHCPRCGNRKLYHIRRYSRTRCPECKFEWSANVGTARAYAKKPSEWYERITELHQRGVNPYRISKIIGAKDSKGVYEFVKRLVAMENLNGTSTT